jgi:hypothetical protein
MSARIQVDASRCVLVQPFSQMVTHMLRKMDALICSDDDGSSDSNDIVGVVEVRQRGRRAFTASE